MLHLHTAHSVPPHLLKGRGKNKYYLLFTIFIFLVLKAALKSVRSIAKIHTKKKPC